MAVVCSQKADKSQESAVIKESENSIYFAPGLFFKDAKLLL